VGARLVGARWAGMYYGGARRTETRRESVASWSDVCALRPAKGQASSGCSVWWAGGGFAWWNEPWRMNSGRMHGWLRFAAERFVYASTAGHAH